MRRTSLAKHLKSTSHEDSVPIYEANLAAETAETVCQANTLSLNSVPLAPPNPQEALAQPSVWVSNDLQHLDINGIDTSEYSGVNFSLGSVDKDTQRLDWSHLGSLFSGGIQEVALEQEGGYDEFAMPLPQRILQDCKC